MTVCIETDYLIIGAGAMAMAFADEILRNDPKAELTFIERRARPGGHWNDAYSYVKLHQPAIAYGINSLELSEDSSDLSSLPQILAYFERAIKRFKKTGRVKFLFKSEYQGNGQVSSLMDPSLVTTFGVRRKVVDSTYMRVEVPSTHPPAYEVEDGVVLVAPNALSNLEQAYEKYVIIGAGKTGMDAILFLLDNGVDPNRIQWIISNDMWIWAREPLIPGNVGRVLLDQAQALIDSDNLEEAYLRLEKAGQIFRLNNKIIPTKWRCATVSRPEYQQLLSINDVVRQGRVQRVKTNQISFENGHQLALSDRVLVVNCSANGLAKREPKKVFQNGLITLQSVLMCQQVFSAGIIGKLETKQLSDFERNRVCQAIPHPESVADLPHCLVQTFENMVEGNRKIPFWFWKARLNMISHGSVWTYLMNAWKVNRLLHRAKVMRERLKAQESKKIVQENQDMEAA